MIYHDAAILNDFDPGFCKRLNRGIIANPRLQPYCLRHLRQDIFNMRRNVLR